jgi:hypothetical protein
VRAIWERVLADADHLTYIKGIARDYPNISALLSKYFAMPVSNARVESVFSVCAHVHRRDRSRLAIGTLSAIVKAKTQSGVFQRALGPVIAAWRSTPHWEDGVGHLSPEEGSVCGVDVAANEVELDPPCGAHGGICVETPSGTDGDAEELTDDEAVDGEDPDFELHDIETHPGYVDGPGGFGKAMEIVQTAFEDIGIPAKTLEIDEAEPTQTVW